MMFCSKCGTQLPDSARFCSTCGAATAVADPQPAPVPETPAAPTPQPAPTAPAPQPVPAAPAPQQSAQYPQFQPAAPVQNTGSQPAKFNFSALLKNKVLVGVVVGVLALALILLIFRPGGDAVNRSAEAAAAAGVEASMEYDVDLMIQCAHSCLIRELAEDLDMPSTTSRTELARALKEQMPSERDYTVTVTIISSTLYDRMTVEQSEIDKDDYDMTWQEYNAIEEVAVVEVEAEAEYKNSDGDRDTDEATVEVLCVKTDGNWYVLDMDG